MTDPLLNNGALERDWCFQHSPITWRVRAARLRGTLTGVRRAPAHRIVVPVRPAPRWSVYFIYAPDGVLVPSHHFTLDRLRARGVPLLIVVATRRPDLIPERVRAAADALVWKALSGFDFSAYALALKMLADASAGCEALVMNDSVMGPFGDVDTLLEGRPWDLTGFTGYRFVENHVQSYAFQLRGITPVRLRSLASVMLPWIAFDDFKNVIYCQESRFARVAARTMSVGALWHGTREGTGDPTLMQALALLDQGFPFMKRSLFAKFAGIQDPGLLRTALAARGHPVPVG